MSTLIIKSNQHGYRKYGYTQYHVEYSIWEFTEVKHMQHKDFVKVELSDGKKRFCQCKVIMAPNGSVDLIVKSDDQLQMTL